MAAAAVEVGVSHAKLEPDSLSRGPPDDFNRDDAWRFLNNWKDAMDDYGEECKKTHRLEEQLAAKEAVLQGTEDALATVKPQLAASDATIAGNLLPLILFSCLYCRSIPSCTSSRLLL